MKPLPRSGRVIPAPFAVPLGGGALLCVGALAAALHGHMSGLTIAALCGVVVLVALVVAEPLTAAPLGLIAWMTATAFAHRVTQILRQWLAALTKVVW